MACVTDDSDPKIVFYHLNKNKPPITCNLESAGDKISINPEDNHTIAITGNAMLRIYRVHENSIRANPNIPKLEMDQNFTDHDWLDVDNLAVGTDKGKLYIVTRKDQKYTVSQVVRDSFFVRDVPVASIKAFSKGLVMCSEEGHFSFWKKFDSAADEEPKDDNTKLFLHSFWGPQEKFMSPTSVDINAKEDSLLVAYKNNHISSLNLAGIVNQETPIVHTDGRDEGLAPYRDSPDLRLRHKQVKFVSLYKGFHFGAIDFIEVCAQRPLVATCSNEDSYVRIWNYMDFRNEFSFRAKLDMPDSDSTRALLSMAFHPNGYYVALGTTSAVKIIYIMENRQKDYRDLSIKGVTLLKFSRGGQYLAAAFKNKANNNHYKINVFDAYTLEMIGSYNSHNVRCTELIWSFNDYYLYSSGDDGCIRAWSRFKKIDENAIITEKNMNFGSVTCDRDSTLFMTAEETSNGNPTGTYYLKDKTENGVVQTYQFSVAHKKPTKICLFETPIRHEALIVGTETGRVLVYPKNIKEGYYQEISAHIDPVSSICTDITGRFLFTAGKDGILHIYQVVSKLNDQVLKESDEAADGVEIYQLQSKCVHRDLANMILVERKDIDQYKERIEKHIQKVEELGSRLEHISNENKLKLEEAKKAAEEKLRDEVAKLNERYNQLVTVKQSVDAQNTNLLKLNDENHLKAVEDLEALYEKKLSYENDKYIRLETELMEERRNNELKLAEIRDSNAKALMRLRQDFASSFEEAQRNYEQTKETTKNLDNEYKKRLAQQEEEHELEIRELNSKHKEDLTKSMKANSKLNKEKEGLAQQLKIATDSKDSLTNQITLKDQEIARLQGRNRDQELKIEKLKKELEQTSETLRKKEKNIYDAKSKINDLQKAKHVLSFRTTEMRKSLEPKEAQIEKLKEELFKLETEFESVFKTTHEQQENLRRRDEHIQKLQAQLKEQTILTKKRDNELNKIKMDLLNCSKMKDNKSLAQEFNKVYQRHVVEEKIREEKPDPKLIGELKRQIDFLENTIHQVNIAAEKQMRNRGVEIAKRTNDNMKLITDLNEMKAHNKRRF